MSIQVEWQDPEKSIQHMTFNGDWTEEDFTEAVRKSVTMNDALGSPLAIISDMRETGTLPPSAITLSRWALQVNDRLQLWVLVTESPFVLALNRAASKVYPRYWTKVVVARTPEEAVTLIKKHRVHAASEV